MSQALTETFNTMRERYKPNVIDGPTTFYFSLGDDPGQKWTMKLTSEACEVQNEKSGNADVVLKVSEELFLKLVRGEWKPGAMDFMKGKIKSNDPMKLQILEDCFTR